MNVASPRYSRQVRLPELGLSGQRRLAEGSVLVIGAGGLGSPVLHLLAGAGVGRLGVADFDVVDVSNLHRQTLYGMQDIGEPKTASARRRIAEVNPDVDVVVHEGQVDGRSAPRVVGGYDLVVDGSDTFATRYAVNGACVAAGVPVVFASVSGFSGQLAVFNAGTGPCYRCLFPEPPPPDAVPSCDVGGVLGPVPAVLGALQASEVLKLLLGIGDPVVGRVVVLDLLGASFRELTVERDPSCPTCGGLTPMDSPLPATLEVSAQDLGGLLGPEADGAVLLDVREASERVGGHYDGPAIPLGQLDARMHELTDYRARPIVAYCRSGGRSASAARLLRDAGYHAYSLRGGFRPGLARPRG